MRLTNNPFIKIHEKLKQITLFDKSLKKVKSTGFRKYLQKLFRLDTIVYKIISFVVISLIVFLSGFLLRQHYLDVVLQPDQKLISGLFHFTINNGLGLGQLSQKSHHLVFFVQSIPIVIGFLAIFALANPAYYICLMFIVFSTMGNVIDRSIDEPLELLNLYPEIFKNAGTGGGNDIKYGVVDYWIFAKSIINLFDVYIVVFVCLLILYLLSTMIISFVKAKNEGKDSKIKEHREDNDTDQLAKDEDLEITTVDKNPFGWDVVDQRDDHKHKKTKKENDSDEE
ncbi:lipoprotein signal peptidase [Ureaplasma miroungigenitalium]|uniref:Lipoprotein signal peptidase n=1 Tax=Ureaplasma miroungigenitalium TaxID=1042321 RepID=A0ABT3BMV1_9BACT|nr:lipoprotein signal peptidase [Ureaplasma miroungigenitalium]MCV3728575.1 lipoprotein signal peptidase [Ureaplasma miroungigenitalium]MCV3734418.1 lipoprotein signal peptidase [Ureaplasma miroungigenitalium]